MNAPIDRLDRRDARLVENWYVAALGRELGAQPLQRIIYDRPLALYRDAHGRAVAVLDRCLHRGALLSQGRVDHIAPQQSTLSCPYHGWTYDTQGALTCVPSEGPSGQRARREARLRTFPTIEQDECIWVWMGEASPPGPPPFRFPHFHDRGWSHYFMITDFANEVTHLAENFMDVPHTVFVHRGWFRRASLQAVPIRVETAQGSVLVTYDQPGDRIGFTTRLLNPRNESMVHTDRFIMPNLTRVDYHFGERRSFLIISQCTPVTTLQTRVYTAIIYRLGVLSRPLKPFFRFYTRRVIEQDVDIMANQGRSLRFDMNQRFRSTDADVVHLAIERLRELGRRGADFGALTRTMEKTIWI